VTGRAAAFIERLGAPADEHARLRAGLPELHALYRDLVRAAAPPNRQYERERIIAQAADPRELVFLFGLLSEGENEAALLLDLIDTVAAADPQAQTDHILDEAWYYLRTSIDAGWQLDDGAPSAAAALAYLYSVLNDRLDDLRRSPPAPPPAESPPVGGEALLRSLRSTFSDESVDCSG
jgi:hypothetical protein